MSTEDLLRHEYDLLIDAGDDQTAEQVASLVVDLEGGTITEAEAMSMFGQLRH